MMTSYKLGIGHRLYTTVNGERFELDAGARIPDRLIAAWSASGELSKIIGAGVIVEASGESSPSTPPARRPAAHRSASGLALRRAQG